MKACGDDQEAARSETFGRRGCVLGAYLSLVLVVVLAQEQGCPMSEVVGKNGSLTWGGRLTTSRRQRLYRCSSRISQLCSRRFTFLVLVPVLVQERGCPTYLTSHVVATFYIATASRLTCD